MAHFPFAILVDVQAGIVGVVVRRGQRRSGLCVCHHHHRCHERIDGIAVAGHHPSGHIDQPDAGLLAAKSWNERAPERMELVHGHCANHTMTSTRLKLLIVRSLSSIDSV